MFYCVVTCHGADLGKNCKKNKKKKMIANIMAVVKANTPDSNPIVISTLWYF